MSEAATNTIYNPAQYERPRTLALALAQLTEWVNHVIAIGQYAEVESAISVDNTGDLTIYTNQACAQQLYGAVVPYLMKQWLSEVLAPRHGKDDTLKLTCINEMIYVDRVFNALACLPYNECFKPMEEGEFYETIRNRLYKPIHDKAYRRG